MENYFFPCKSRYKCSKIKQGKLEIRKIHMAMWEFFFIDIFKMFKLPVVHYQDLYVN